MGVQTGRDVEVFDSYELGFTMVDGKPVLDKTYFLAIQEKCEFIQAQKTSSRPTNDLLLH